MAEQKIAPEIGNVKGLEVVEVPFINKGRASREDSILGLRNVWRQGSERQTWASHWHQFNWN